MGTPSIIGTAHDGGFTGRYCHWDGYPTCRAAQLLATYRELDNDWEAVLQYAVKPEAGEMGYWSSYQTPIQAALELAKPDKVPCEHCNGTGNRTDGKCRPNWCNGCDSTGMARNLDKQTGYQTGNGGGWASDQDEMGAEWVYLLDEHGITVLSGWTAHWKRYGMVPWDTPESDEDALLESIEQGILAAAWG